MYTVQLLMFTGGYLSKYINNFIYYQKFAKKENIYIIITNTVYKMSMPKEVYNDNFRNKYSHDF